MLPVDVPVQCRVCVLDSGHQIGRGPDGFPPLLNGVCYLDREAVGIERARSDDGSEAESAGNFVIQNDDIGSRGEVFALRGGIGCPLNARPVAWWVLVRIAHGREGYLFSRVPASPLHLFGRCAIWIF